MNQDEELVVTFTVKTYVSTCLAGESVHEGIIARTVRKYYAHDKPLTPATAFLLHPLIENRINLIEHGRYKGMEVSTILDTVTLLLTHPQCPPETLSLAIRCDNPAYAEDAFTNPNCIEEDQVYYALKEKIEYI